MSSLFDFVVPIFFRKKFKFTSLRQGHSRRLFLFEMSFEDDDEVRDRLVEKKFFFENLNAL